ncbi:MAG: hypothetical protein KBS83_08030 [Lachnospiraceae bacterium]|nr:hypothetical protein [Candidatus Equihabitans merdae]
MAIKRICPQGHPVYEENSGYCSRCGERLIEIDSQSENVSKILESTDSYPENRVEQDRGPGNNAPIDSVGGNKAKPGSQPWLYAVYGVVGTVIIVICFLAFQNLNHEKPSSSSRSEAVVVSESESEAESAWQWEPESEVESESEWESESYSISQEVYEPYLQIGQGQEEVLKKHYQGCINMRAEPTHDSDLVRTIDEEVMHYAGEWAVGKGSDGQDHYWCKVECGGYEGWVRSDLVMRIEGAEIAVFTNPSSVNLRQESTHYSHLVYTAEGPTQMYFYGEVSEGYGSDDQWHKWIKVYLTNGVCGWVRIDLAEIVM